MESKGGNPFAKGKKDKKGKKGKGAPLFAGKAKAKGKAGGNPFA
jgi:hypothetical protein